MKKNLIHLAGAFVFCLLTLKIAVGCAVISVPSLTKFDSSEYIFIGEVVGVADPFESEKFHGEAWGLKVAVKDFVRVPKTPASHFVVVPFDLESDCRNKGWSRDQLLTYFPLGSEVRVIAKASEYAASQMADGNIRLEIWSDDLGSIARNYSEVSKSISSAGAIYDYRSYVAQSRCGLSQEDMPDYVSHMELPEFEYRKDLLRLKKAKSKKERVKILERLVYSPRLSGDFRDVAAQHLRDRKIIKGLNQKRKTWERILNSKLVLSCP